MEMSPIYTLFPHNISNYNTAPPRERNVTYTSNLSPEFDFLLGCYMLLLVVMSIILNLVVLVTVCKSSQRLHPLEIYVVNLAVIDLCPAVFDYPFTSFSAFNHGWAFGNIGCTMAATNVYFFGIASISTVTVMSVMRYIKICHQDHNIQITHRFVYITLVPIYANSLAWSLGPALGWGSYAVEAHGNACTLNWTDLSVSYIVCMFAFIYILPCFLIIFSYGRIYSFVRKSTRGMQLMSSKMDAYMAKLTFAMTFLFMTAWTPYAILAFYYVITERNDVPVALSTLAPTVCKSTTLVNPLVYFLSIKRFQRESMKIFLPWLNKVKQEGENSNGKETRATTINVFTKNASSGHSDIDLGEEIIGMKTLESGGGVEIENAEEAVCEALLPEECIAGTCPFRAEEGYTAL